MRSRAFAVERVDPTEPTEIGDEVLLISTSPFLFWRFCILFIPHPLHPVSIDNNTENLNKRRSLFVYLHIADPAFNREYSVCMKLRLAGGYRVSLTASGAR